jgi:hypothetical protein
MSPETHRPPCHSKERPPTAHNTNPLPIYRRAYEAKPGAAR